MLRGGVLCEGDIPAEISSAQRKARVARMRESGKPTIGRMATMIDLSVPCMRHRVMKSDATSMRYRVRALASQLPTYRHEAKRIAGGNSYEYMYGSELGVEGECQRCDMGKRETIAHIFSECPAQRETRLRVSKELNEVWEGVRNKRGEWVKWDNFNYIDTTPVGWEEEWGWLGLVPKAVQEGCSRADPRSRAESQSPDGGVLQGIRQPVAESGHTSAIA